METGKEIKRQNNLNLIEVSILVNLRKHRGRLVTVDLISKNPEDQTLIHKYIDGLVKKEFVEKIGEDAYRLSVHGAKLELLQA
ncbi:hypothetical protein QNH47_00820 [Virgibacillus halodenitrificans]|uniref:hypothetical protein n=1 Tax=Virgibacillus halodenitrificans TaxID=1482 RepID=UPI0024C09D9E|nr:hypothetical protein [Virgibacillus halodenitrificans]WHX26427.1 hypothetical protein QNH47_00820 [Virgibacillus halodenitrificans]